MSLDLADLYRVSGTDKVLDLDTDLRKDLDELKAEIEENEMVHQIPHKPISSVPLPKDAEYFMKERKLVIDRVLQHKIGYTWQPELMVEEVPWKPREEPLTYEKLLAGFLTYPH